MQAQSGDHVRALGRIALGSRLKRLSERLLSDVARVYESQGIDFKPPWFPLFSLVAEAKIVNPQYGTRCSTVLLDSGKDMRYSERAFDAEGGEGTTLHFQIPGQSPI
jgi:hypothetical protein